MLDKDQTGHTLGAINNLTLSQSTLSDNDASKGMVNDDFHGINQASIEMKTKKKL